MVASSERRILVLLVMCELTDVEQRILKYLLLFIAEANETIFYER